MRLMGIDYGGKRVGVALSDETGRFAIPHGVLQNDSELLNHLLKLCVKERVGKIVLGRSLDYKMQPNEIMAKIETFKTELELASNLPVEYENEFMTTMEAERLQGKGNKIDASAAALILKSYIDRQR
ncbi:MAG: Holliday junction resolvase RuvX [bacterium]|nr:Holliday junction resolvase RuvX [bacterium]